MIGLDTNVLVRYIMQDDPVQSPKADRIIESLTPESPGFVSIVSVMEVYWVLTSCYMLSDAQAVRALELTLRTRQFVVENVDVVLRAIRHFSATPKADFADCLITAAAAGAGCHKVVTFDRGAAKYAGMSEIVG